MNIVSKMKKNNLINNLEKSYIFPKFKNYSIELDISLLIIVIDIVLFVLILLKEEKNKNNIINNGTKTIKINFENNYSFRINNISTKHYKINHKNNKINKCDIIYANKINEKKNLKLEI